MSERLYAPEERAALERYSLLIKATCDLVWEWNIQENTLWWNNNFRNWVGNPAEQELQTDIWKQRVHPADLTRIMREVDTLLENGGNNWSGEYRFLRGDGVYAHVHDRGYVEYVDGKPLRIVGVTQDVSEQVREAQLRSEAEAEQSFALQAAEIGTWVLYPLTSQVKWDERCKQLYGFSKADFVSFDLVLKYIHKEDVALVQEAVARALDAQTGGGYDIRFRTIGAEDKRLRWLHCRGQAYFDEKGIAYRFAGIAQDITAQVETRRQAEKAERIARMAVERTGVGTFFIDMNTGEDIYSPTAARILTGVETTGISREMLIAHVHPEDREIRRQAYEKALETGYLQYEARFIWHDDSVHAAKITGMYNFDSSGTPVDFSGLIQDITPEMHARQEQRKLLSIVEYSENIKAVSDTSGKLVYLNRTGRKLMGIRGEEELPVTRLQDYFLTDHPVFSEAAWSGTLQLKRLHSAETIPCHAEIRKIFDYGTFIGYGATLRDLRPELEARRVLEESERRFRDLVMASPSPIGVYLGEEQRVALVNQAILDTWEKDASVIGKTFEEALPEMKGQPFTAILKQVYNTGVPYEAREQKVLLMRNGQLTSTWFNFSYTPLKNQEGGVYGVLNTAEEITDVVKAKHVLAEAEIRLEQQVEERTAELQAATEELQATTEELQSTNEELTTTNEELNEANMLLQRSNKELEQYAFVASHDLQEPLRKIRLYAGMVHNTKDIPEMAREMLAKIIYSGERMSVLIKDLLEFSRLLRNEKALGMVDLNTVLRNVLSDFEVAILDKHAQVQYDPLPAIEAEPLQMNQLVFNLISNALKFTRPGVSPEISIRVKSLRAEELEQEPLIKGVKQWYAIAVADNGIGFDIRYADQIFEVFKRLHTRDLYPGSGIGLALCRKIVQNHNGWLQVQSQEGVGTVITAILPQTQHSTL